MTRHIRCLGCGEWFAAEEIMAHRLTATHIDRGEFYA